MYKPNRIIQIKGEDGKLVQVSLGPKEKMPTIEASDYKSFNSTLSNY